MVGSSVLVVLAGDDELVLVGFGAAGVLMLLIGGDRTLR